VIAWRICKTRRVAAALSGEGAAKIPGRWNSTGRPMVYLAESRALAAMEILVHVEDVSLLSAASWSVVPVEFEESLASTATHLPDDWDAVPAPVSTRGFGDRWLDGQRSLLLRVPSAVVNGEFNFLLNPNHPDIRKAKARTAEVFYFDHRLGRLKA
jgi:RES domain-containing protein